MWWPQLEEATHWMVAQGLDASAAPALLRAAGGRPDDALLFASSGRDANSWAVLPRALQRGDLRAMQNWTAPEMLDALHKLCHDMQLVQQGATPRFFAATDLPLPAPLNVLSRWGRDLAYAMRTMEHPFNPGLMQEALLSQAKSALNSKH